MVRITCRIRPLLHRRQRRSSAVGRDCSRQSPALPPSMAVEYGRILPSRALLATHISALGAGHVILTTVLGHGHD